MSRMDLLLHALGFQPRQICALTGDKNHLSSVTFCTLQHKNWGQSLVPAIQEVEQPGKMSLWLLLPSLLYMRSLDQFLIAYTFSDLVVLYLQYNTCMIMAGVS